MTTAGTDDDEEEECFHQSLDRILSSSSSSTSVEDEDVVSNSPSNIFPKFPMCVPNYDFWASDAAFSATSIRHRRHHFLCSLGYSFSNNFAPHPDSRIFQSKPEISTCTECDSYHRCASLNDECSLLSDYISPTTVLSVPSLFDNTVNSGLRADTIEVDVAHSDSSSVKLSRTGNRSDEMCTTNNLDSGNEFLVNKVAEDYMCAINSPIVEKPMRQQVMESLDVNGNGNDGDGQSKKNVSWFKSVKSAAKSVIGYKRHKSNDREKGGQRSSSAMNGSKDSSFHRPERVRIRWYGNSVKDLTGLYKIQEIQAHNGSIWSIKFSLDGRYLATAGEDCVIHVWQVVESERKFPKPNSDSRNIRNPLERKMRGMMSISQKSMGLDNIVVPETVFGLSEKPVCSFQGHLDDVLDLSWSKSEHLLSSSMDKTVRLWNLSSKTCLKVFSHVGYVTCVQFNPVDDRYFISGSLDGKVRIWSIPDRQVVDWIDLYEMVTAACYTPDGQGALVGSHNGSCRLYNISENKLQPKSQFNLLNKKKKEHLKKITGFEFAPGNPSVVLITSADSRVRVVDGVDLVLKFKGFCNTDSQISASITTDGKYVVCASEDSNVYVWKHEAEYQSSKNKRTTCSYEHFHCQDVSVAIPWPGGVGHSCRLRDERNEAHNSQDEAPTNNRPPPTTPVDEFGGIEGPPSASRFRNANPFCGTLSSVTNSYFFDRFRATWPEEKLLLVTENKSMCPGLDLSNGVVQNGSAWGLVIVTAGLKGEIRTYQNFGLPAQV